MTKQSDSNEIHLTRLYDSPVKNVWRAWTDPAETAQWWGPRGFTITTHTKDFRVGGSWKYTMHGPDGIDYPNNTKYLEIEEFKKLVYDHGGNDDRPPLFRVTVFFSENEDKTTMQMIMALPTPEAATQTKAFIKKAGGDATWDRLAEYLNKKVLGKETFVINRTFDATLNLLFELWTDPKHISNWLAPTGFSMEFIRADIKPGGGNFYRMFADTLYVLHGKNNYLEINKPREIIYTQQFCDEDENISRHPMAPTWPETMLTTVQFASESPNRTRVTATWEPHGAVTKGEIETFIQSRAGMTQGWTGSFDKLEMYLQG